MSKRGRYFLVSYSFSLCVISGLDAVALVLLSRIFLGSGSALGSDLSSHQNVSNLGWVMTLFVLRTIFSTFTSWLAMKRLSHEEVIIGTENLKNNLSSSWESRRISPLSAIINSVDQGPTDLVQGLLLLVATLIGEVVTSIVIMSVILALQPLTAVISILYFGLVILAQHRFLSKASARAGEEYVESYNTVYSLLDDIHRLAKPLAVMPSNSVVEYSKISRQRLASARAKASFLNTLPRYSMELILAVGMLLIGSITFLLKDANGAMTALVLFGAAGFRLLPILNRVQGIVLQLFSTLPRAMRALENPVQTQIKVIPSAPSSKNQVLVLEDVSYKFSDAKSSAIQSINFEFLAGKQYAVIGGSGSGKTTFVEICMGLLQPTQGRILRNSKLKIGYVPQETYVSNTTLLENVLLEWGSDLLEDREFETSLSLAQLNGLFDHGRLDSAKGSINNAAMSGGQKQRIGIARALFRNPDLLIFDEATSALDFTSENKIMSAIDSFRGEKTSIIIAHRLSTIRNADCVLYFREGRIVASGSFEELRSSIPELEEQIKLGSFQ